MASIGDFGKIPPSQQTHLSSQGATNPESEATQMDLTLTLMLELIYVAYPQEKTHPLYTRSIVALLKNFSQEMQQKPIPVNKMEEQYNQMTDSIKGWFPALQFPHWSLSADQAHPGKSFVTWLLSFAQEVAGLWQSAKIDNWVGTIGNFINQNSWNANAVNSLVQEFFQDFNHLGKNPHGGFIPPQMLPPNLFNE